MPLLKPTFLFDAANSRQLPARVTLTRASGGSYYDRLGVLRQAAANQPRFDFDPVTLACRGLLIEEQRTNLLLYSNAFDNAVWVTNTNGTATAPVVTPAYRASPDGTANAYRLQCSLGGGTASTDWSFIAQQISGLANPHTPSVSIWAISNTGANQTVYFRNIVGSGGTAITVTPTWQRFSFVGASYAATTNNLQIGARGTVSQDSVDISIYGAQHELGAFSTSYIPTVASQVTRAAEVLTIPAGAAFEGMHNALQGTLVSKLFRERNDPSNYLAIASINDATANNRLTFGINAAASSFRVLRNTAAAGLIQTPLTTNAPLSGRNQVACRFGGGNIAIVANGGAVASAVHTMATVTQMTIGSQLGAAYFNNWLASLAYYPALPTDAELQALTA